jgi:hypothetical protein
MYPKLQIEVEGKDPLIVETLPEDFMMYEELQGSKQASEQGLRLTIAYYYSEGKEPLTLKTVKDWARATKCRVDIISEDVNPTQPDHITD